MRKTENVSAIIKATSCQDSTEREGIGTKIWIISVVAFVSTVLCVLLWCREVRRIMRELKSTMVSAETQLAACREKAAVSKDQKTMAVLERSENIYRQAVANYNAALCRPLVGFPAALMGFHQNDGGEP